MTDKFREGKLSGGPIRMVTVSSPDEFKKLYEKYESTQTTLHKKQDEQEGILDNEVKRQDRQLTAFQKRLNREGLLGKEAQKQLNMIGNIYRLSKIQGSAMVLPEQLMALLPKGDTIPIGQDDLAKLIQKVANAIDTATLETDPDEQLKFFMKVVGDEKILDTYITALKNAEALLKSDTSKYASPLLKIRQELNRLQLRMTEFDLSPPDDDLPPLEPDSDDDDDDDDGKLTDDDDDEEDSYDDDDDDDDDGDGISDEDDDDDDEEDDDDEDGDMNSLGRRITRLVIAELIEQAQKGTSNPRSRRKASSTADGFRLLIPALQRNLQTANSSTVIDESKLMDDVTENATTVFLAKYVKSVFAKSKRTAQDDPEAGKTDIGGSGLGGGAIKKTKLTPLPKMREPMDGLWFKADEHPDAHRKVATRRDPRSIHPTLQGMWYDDDGHYFKHISELPKEKRAPLESGNMSLEPVLPNPNIEKSLLREIQDPYYDMPNHHKRQSALDKLATTEHPIMTRPTKSRRMRFVSPSANYTIQDGRLGVLDIDVSKLSRRWLVVHRGFQKLYDTPIHEDLVILLTRRKFDPRHKYDDGAVELYRELVGLSGLPTENTQSKKARLITGGCVNCIKQGCSGCGVRDEPVSGSGKVKILTNMDEVVEHLNHLVGTLHSGNNSKSIKSEISETVQVLRDKGVLSPEQYDKLHQKYVLA